MSTNDDYYRRDEGEEKKTLTRIYKNEAIQHCTVCADLHLPERDPTADLQDYLEDIPEAAQQGCSFCALVSRSARRQQRVFKSLPWDHVNRQIQYGSGIARIKHSLGYPPRNEVPLVCARLDSVDLIGLSPETSISIKTKGSRSGTLAGPVTSTGIKHQL
jgi:hypothetical protein